MPSYWWVNHKQTLHQEIDGQYLWSPKTNKGGSRSHFYDNMRRANPGDFVFSFANGRIGWVGRVTDYAIACQKPSEFGSIGAYWDNEGWYLPVYWTPLSPAVSPKALLEDLRPLLPEKYSPVSPETGNGYQHVYLASVSPSVFDLVTSATAYSHDSLLFGGDNSLTYAAVTEHLDDQIERAVQGDTALDTTVKASVIQARRGQGVFRRNVEAREKACRLTGITNPALLIASHIKPWRACTTADERLDGANGLMLTPDADHLFDRGFITFADDGDVLVSRRVPDDDLRRLGFEQLMRQRSGLSDTAAVWQAGALSESCNQYLGYHRSQVFIA